MNKEVKFLTENSQDKEKNLSFKEQILNELAEAGGEGQPSDLEPAADNKEAMLTENIESLLSSVEGSHKALAEVSEETPAADSLVNTETSEEEKAEDGQTMILESLIANLDTEAQAADAQEVKVAEPETRDGESMTSSKVPVSYKVSGEAAPEPQVEEEPAQKISENLSRADRARNTKKKKRQNKVARNIVLTVLLIVLIGVGVTGFVGYNYFSSALKPIDANSTEYVTVEIPAGSSSKEIGEILEKNGLIKNAQVFNLYSKIRSYGNYQSGYYNLQKSMDLDSIAKQLQEGGTETPQPPVLGKITIPEGYTLEQIAETVTANAAATSKKNAKTPFSKEDFLNKVQDEDFIAKMLAKYPQLLATLPGKDSGVKYRLEGYLFPATYEYGKETTVEELIDQMLAAMNTNLSQYYSTIESKNLTVNEVLTLASLVEKEGSTDQDRKDIASVFYNRLNQAMPLQSNIALLYAQGKLGKKTTLKEDAEIDTNIDSPYNVYKNQGLMPGPVDSPSLSALEATINPSKTDYLYFVANVETGVVYFANTYEEHAKNVEEHVNSKLTQ
ncbi:MULTISPECIES: endolytic transglycosylase MltG [Streptococcus]|uniref:endolytic transglycosylase MltG n=1 Tax=Streptococcus TaxID=1301 RepID=UPI001F1FF3F2|nr:MULTISPECIES: endolytic transglycosylase MltG [Streptococcus]MCF1284420.1 endolytic transglycosylase MltG [Streptococcus sinensis]MCY7218176.1 endolytic transglycosylase MltG [Streptococcus cristatus]